MTAQKASRPNRNQPRPDASPLRRTSVKAVVALLILLAVGVVFYTNRWLTERFTETTRNRAELRLALYSGNVVSELQRTSVVPLLLARDPAISEALAKGDFSRSSQRLAQVQNDIGVASILLLDDSGRVVGATNRNLLGSVYRNADFYVAAMRSADTVFSASQREGGGYDFTYSQVILGDGQPQGVIVVEVDLMKFERAWAGLQDVVLISDSGGTVILSTEPRWRGLPVDQLTVEGEEDSALNRALDRALTMTRDITQNRPDTYLRGVAVLQTDNRMTFRGWHMTSFTAYDPVREKVNGILALEIMGFAILAALTFYLVSRRAYAETLTFRRESIELRQLNARLQREIAEREKVQKELSVAEQTLAQSSKLAVLGEMSAAVSHELNQPLAAMKTYLAGARLLLTRKRTDEALSSFQRIDDLIDRMGAITRQLKSYARKGGEAFEPVDMRLCLSSALAMMEPQLKQRVVRITRSLPRQPVMVNVDRLRLEQVIINILRNALDATKDTRDPQIDLVLAAGDTAVLTVRDNGHGIADLDNLFEPFYTTKKSGEGVGLGLAISSGIVTDLGGRLTARNAEGTGAVFEMQLPVLERPEDMKAAE
ncbi:ATP-binding protein [Rhodobacter sp. KR11]|uniref:sensor histidine kinase n=1 Tax=Rhodobacter sp. KR11 TaxID=2974588 RepID=UPI0022224F50|nr:ATP-binding protein [Rhodobacter sp. KR11]MCW1919878.1 ATP-binding protein [Rhodobacter sp. KR11]